jgi:HAD superfamily hydrolase (TIGR01509 family)
MDKTLKSTNNRLLTAPDLQALIFDMDGLMVDSESWAHESYNRVLAPYGPAMTEEEYAQLVGWRAIDQPTFFQQRWGIAETELPRILAARRPIFLEIMRERLAPMPGLLHVIALARQRGLRLAVASSSRLPYIHLILDGLGLAGIFDAVVSGAELPQSKPDPTIYIHTLEQLGVSARAAVALEDSEQGVKAARAAGLRVIAIPNRYTRHQRLDDADLQLSSLAEITWERLIGSTPH